MQLIISGVRSNPFFMTGLSALSLISSFEEDPVMGKPCLKRGFFLVRRLESERLRTSGSAFWRRIDQKANSAQST